MSPNQTYGANQTSGCNADNAGIRRSNPDGTIGIIDCLTDGGIVEPAAFYESPFTDIDDQGIAGVFDREQTKTIIEIVRTLNGSAAA